MAQAPSARAGASWLGPLRTGVPPEGHPVGNAAAVGWALHDGVYVDGARVGALASAAGSMLRTSAARETHCGVGLVLRVCSSPELRLEHLLFAPAAPRPILLAWVELRNLAQEILVVRYSELWDLPCATLGAEGACSGHTARGLRVLADAGNAVRGRAPEGESQGLALDMTLALPPGESRQLSFAYALPGAEDDPARLVRAWRGRVRDELESSVAERLDSFGGSADPLAAYRASFLAGRGD